MWGRSRVPSHRASQTAFPLKAWEREEHLLYSINQSCKQLFEGRLHAKTIELLNKSAEKGDILSGEDFHRRFERLIGRATIKGLNGGSRNNERFKNHEL